MEKRKELIKSFILLMLVISSIILTFSIAGYKPEYEILGTSSDKRRAEQDYSKLQLNTLNLFSPYIITKKEKGFREEVAIPNAITKVAYIQAVRDKLTIKNILTKISNSKIEETRVRNKSIEEVEAEAESFYTFNYKYDIDTLSSKIIYLGENNQAVSFDFDTVLVSSSKPNNIYIYKKGSDNYLQLEYDNNIYKSVDDTFMNNNSNYFKYSIGNEKEVYIKDYSGSYYIDTYSYSEIDILNVANNIFIENNNIKISNRDEETKEATDGYSILRDNGTEITYINPSNLSNSKIKNTDISVQSKASSFLVTGYVPNIDYEILNISDNIITYQEVYKDGIVFSNDSNSSIKIKVSGEGVYQAFYPKLIKTNHISSEVAPIFSVENISEILNYLYSNVNLNYVDDIELGYEKIYKENNMLYIPRWYVKYKGNYMKYTELKEKIKKGDM